MHQDTRSRFGKFPALYSVIIALVIFAMYPITAQAQNEAPSLQNNILWQWLSAIPETDDRKPARPAGNSTSADSSSKSAIGSIYQDEEAEMVSLINQERAKAGLPELQADPTLKQLARAKSRDMVRFNYFGHSSERFGTVYDQLEHAGVRYQIVAENLIGASSCIKAIQYENQSPAHRSNLLNPKFTRIGVGIVRGGPYGLMITQILIR